MKSKRIVKIAPAGANYSKAQAEALANDLATAQTELESLVAARDAAQIAAAEPYAPAIDKLRVELDAGVSTLEAWAEANLHEFGKLESVTLSGHRIGWRLGNFAAKLASKWTWAKVLDALLESPASVRDRWLRTKVEPNKEAMIQDRDTEGLILATYGVKIIQERRFYFDPAREGQDEKTLKAS